MKCHSSHWKTKWCNILFPASFKIFENTVLLLLSVIQGCTISKYMVNITPSKIGQIIAFGKQKYIRMKNKM